MIAKANTHNSGSRLATYLTRKRDGQTAEVWQLRGFEADNIKDALRDIDIIAGATKCENPLFHVQIRIQDGERLTREQWEHAATSIEQVVGFAGQPRAIVFHTYQYTGDVHMHIAFSRIDEETMTAKPVPYFKLVLKEVTRDLEQELGLTPVRKEREGPIKYAPTKAEDEQARRLGVDVNAVRNTIRACWDQSDCGSAFVSALNEHDLVLAKGDEAPFLVLDQAGGIHPIGQRILDKPAAFIRQKMADIDREHLPSIEAAREQILDVPANRLSRLQREFEEIDKLIADADPDMLARARKNIEDQKVREQLAALDRENNEALRRDIEEIDRLIAEIPVRKKPDVQPLWNADLEIRSAYAFTNTGQEFANSLEDRGLILARVTDKDAERMNRWERQRVSEKWQPPEDKKAVWMAQPGGADQLSPEHLDQANRSYQKYLAKKMAPSDPEDRDPEEEKPSKPLSFDRYVSFVREHYDASEHKYERYREGELVVIDQFSGVHQLTYKNTGDSFEGREKHFKDIDTKPLMSVSAADATMQKFREHGRGERELDWQEKKEDRQRAFNEKLWPINPPKPERASSGLFGQAADEAARDRRPEDAHGVAAHLWHLWSHIDPEQRADAIRRSHEIFGKLHEFSIATDQKAFVKALEDRGITFAIATKEEAAESRRLSDFAREVGNYSPRFKEGEIVIVTEQRNEFRRDGEIIEPGRVHKIDQSLAEKFVRATGGRDKLHSIDGAISLSDNRAQQRRADREEAALDRATDIKDFSRALPGKAQGTIRKAIRMADRTLGGVGKGIDAIADAFSSLFAPTLTPEQAREAEITQEQRVIEGEIVQQRREAEADRTHQERQGRGR